MKQYPQWNGLLGADTNIDIKDVDSSDQLKIKFVGGEGTVIGGGMTVSGYGQNLGGDPSTYSEYVATEFENVTFAGPSTLLDLNAGATHVTFTNCTFAGGSYIVVGGARFDTVHDIRFIGCTFEDAGVISGYWSSMQMENCNGTMGGGGFINIQGGTETTVKNCNISCSAGSLKYVIRTNSAAKLHFENSTIEVTGASELLYLRGGDTEISFDGCTLRYQADDLVRDGSNAGAKVWIDGQQVYPTAP